jgi:hypothetical protein
MAEKQPEDSELSSPLLAGHPPEPSCRERVELLSWDFSLVYDDLVWVSKRGLPSFRET